MGCGAQQGRPVDHSMDVYVTTDAPSAFVDRLRVEIPGTEDEIQPFEVGFTDNDPLDERRTIVGPIKLETTLDAEPKEVLVRIRGFSTRSRRGPPPDRMTAPATGALCYGHPELQLDDSMSLVQGDGFPNQGGPARG